MLIYKLPVLILLPLRSLLVRIRIEYDSLAVVQHIVLLVQVDLCYLRHPLVQREHQVVLCEALAPPVPEEVTAHLKHHQLRLTVKTRGVRAPVGPRWVHIVEGLGPVVVVIDITTIVIVHF